MLMKKCAFETSGMKNTHTAHLSQLSSMDKMALLSTKAEIFQPSLDRYRKITAGFFWGFLDRPTDVGSKRDKDKEQKIMTEEEKRIHERLCGKEGKHGHYEEFDILCDEEADDEVSHSSSVFAHGNKANVVVDDVNGPADKDDWENLNERDKDRKIGDCLKHMGNVKRRKTSRLILKDMLVRGGAATLKDLKKNCQKSLACEKHKTDNIICRADSLISRCKLGEK